MVLPRNKGFSVFVTQNDTYLRLSNPYLQIVVTILKVLSVVNALYTN